MSGEQQPAATVLSAADSASAHWVASRLGLDECGTAWTAELATFALPDPPLALIERGGAKELLERLGCPPESVADAVATLPDPERDPERWWLLERCRARLVAGMGRPELPRGPWPKLPDALGPAGGSFYLHLVLALLDDVLAYHGKLGVPEEISWATLADLGRHVALEREATGRTGIDEPWWITLHLRGILVEIGRLQYTSFRLGEGPEHPSPWYDPEEADRRGEGFRSGDPALGIHIPGGAPLAPADCEESLQQASALTAAIWPVSGRRLATCASWLLDDQLVAMLGEGSNIASFQRRFQLVPGAIDGDDAVRTFVFRSHAPLDELRARSTLQRAVLAHLRSGGHFSSRTGWLDLPGGG